MKKHKTAAAPAPVRQGTCTTLDHVYPRSKFGTPCYCGARVWGKETPKKAKVLLIETPGSLAVLVEREGAEKGVDSPSSGVLQFPQPQTSSRDASQGAAVASAPIQAPETKETRVITLTFKGLNKKGTQAIYSGARASVRFPLNAFDNKQAPPHLDINGLAAPEVKTPKAKMTPEERAAARAAKPKPTLAERVAAAEKRAAALKAKLEAEPAAAL